jgi:type I restriction enzyme M protein
MPEGRKQYNKTQPMQFEEFAPVIAWWNDRKENEHAWKVSAKKIIESGYNLDIKNPNFKAYLAHLPPEQLTESILKKEQRIAEIMNEIRCILSKGL